ncbi:MAG: hypothetical protein QXQ33_00770 [Nitrososphaerota archaeon]
MKFIKIIIDGDNLTIETEGFLGKECVSEVDKLIQYLKNLGLEFNAEKIEYKNEYFVSKIISKTKVRER